MLSVPPSHPSSSAVAVRFFALDWDAESHVPLPPELTLQVPSEQLQDMEQTGPDLLSAHTGWCVKSFLFEVVTAPHG